MTTVNGTHIENLGLDMFPYILSYLDTASLVRCTRVSKAWRSFLLSSLAGDAVAFRSLWPEHDVEKPHVSSLRLWFDRVTDLVASRGGLHELRVQAGVIPDSTALKLVACSAERLVRLELHLLPERTSNARGSFWRIKTVQDNVNDAATCILTSCPNLLHLSLSAPYQDDGWLTDASCFTFIVPPSFSDSQMPQLRSLCLCDLKPRYDIHFFRLVEHVESLSIAGKGLQSDRDGDNWSPAALRVLLRYLERGDKIQSLELEGYMDEKEQSARSLFAGISDDLVSRNEVDQRWETENAAQSALQENLTKSLIYNPDGDEYGPPRVIRLSHLEKLRVVSGMTMVDFEITPVLVKRNREISRIQAPRLADFFIDCAALQYPLTSLMSSIDPPHCLRKLTLQRPDATMAVEDMLDFLHGLPGIEELSFIFTFPGGHYYAGSDLFRIKKLISALSVPIRNWSSSARGDWILPRLRKLHLADDESVTGRALIGFVLARERAHKAWLNNPEGVKSCASLETLVLYSGPFTPYKALRLSQMTKLRAHLVNFSKKREKRLSLSWSGPEDEEEVDAIKDNENNDCALQADY